MQKSIKERRIEFELNQQQAYETAQKTSGLSKEVEEVQKMVSGPIHCSLDDLADRAKAFDMFRKSYRKNEAMEDNRNELKDKYTRGKQLGQEVHLSREVMKKLTGDIEQIRRQNAMRGLVDENGEIMSTPEEKEIQAKIAQQKKVYQQQYSELKDLKSEIEKIQSHLERCRERMGRDFDQWLQVMVRQKQTENMKPGQENRGPNNGGAGGVQDAKVMDNLKEFYKARDAIYSETGRS